MNAMPRRRRALGAVSVLAATLASTILASAATAAAPVNSAAPTITGTPNVGQTLTVQNGTWQNAPTAFQYRWQRCGTDGAGCTAIPGATAKTYALVAADAGHTMRARVTAVNADGAANARTAPTAVVSSPGSPKNTDSPTVSGEAKVGEELAAEPGRWTGTTPTFTYQWQRCDVDGSNCFDVGGATGKTYGVRLADLGFRLRVEVTARNSSGSGTAMSAVTSIVQPVRPIPNGRPTLKILSVRFLGARAYARVRVCDDSLKNLTIMETDSRPGKASYARRFSTLIAPQPCGVYTRNWVPAPRFRGPGRYTITLRARDKSATTSLPARRSFAF